MKQQSNTTIKAHLVRGALYLLLLLAVCAIPFALAQRNATNRSVIQATHPNAAFNLAAAPTSTDVDHIKPTVSSGAISVPSIVPPLPKDPQVVLYDQYNNASDLATL